MAEHALHQPGDHVVHPARPEWGEGVVAKASAAVLNGRPGQRLVVDFANHGRVTIHTAAVALHTKDLSTQMSHTTSSTPDKGWLNALEQARDGEDLTRLGDALTDPFSSLAARLKATLDAYRFSTEPRNLIDWAVAQTGLDDPLATYTRHELEKQFPFYARAREQHLRELVRTIKREQKHAILDEAVRDTRNPAARQALRDAMRA